MLLTVCESTPDEETGDHPSSARRLSKQYGGGNGCDGRGSKRKAESGGDRLPIRSKKLKKAHKVSLAS